jgi:hypothetical protein
MNDISLIEQLEKIVDEFNILTVEEPTDYTSIGLFDTEPHVVNNKVMNISLGHIDLIEGKFVKSASIKYIPNVGGINFIELTLIQRKDKSRTDVGGALHNVDCQTQAYYTEELVARMHNLLVQVEDKFNISISEKIALM